MKKIVSLLLCLAMMLRAMGRKIRPMRVLAAALLGALAAQIVRGTGLVRAQIVLLWLPLALAMAGLGGGGFHLRAACTLLACYGLLGGTVTALAGAAGSLPLAWAIGAGFACLSAACALRARRAAGDVRTVRVQITYAGRTVGLDAVVDSGNSLRDYLTHRPVIVMPEAAGRKLLVLGDAALRPIFADTAGGRQMMSCLTPQCTRLCLGKRTADVRACLALSPALAPDAPALVPQSLLDEGFGEEEGDAYGNAEG